MGVFNLPEHVWADAILISLCLSVSLYQSAVFSFIVKIEKLSKSEIIDFVTTKSNMMHAASFLDRMLSSMKLSINLFEEAGSK